MKIGVIGAGNIGGTIGAKWSARNHEVFFGVRDPKKASLVEKIGEMTGSVRVGHSAEAIVFADVVVFAVPGASVGPIVEENLDTLRGKTLIDATNNMRGESRHALGVLREKLPEASCTVRSVRWGGRIWPIQTSRAPRPTCSSAETRLRERRSRP